MRTIKESRTFIYHEINKLVESPQENKQILSNIIRVIKKNCPHITKNLRGYWIDINCLPEACVDELITCLQTIISNEEFLSVSSST